MRKVVLSVLAAASALAAATPAAAQYYPAPQPGYGYNNGYNGYGYNNQGQTGRWAGEVNRIRRDIDMLRSQGRLTNRELRRLNYDTSVVENAIRKYGYNGLTRYEAQDLDRRVHNLHRAVSQMANNRSTQRYGNNGYNSYNGNNGYNGYGQDQWVDRDRDGRNDRYEDDRGSRHD